MCRKCYDKGCIQHCRNLSHVIGSTIKNHVQCCGVGFCSYFGVMKEFLEVNFTAHHSLSIKHHQPCGKDRHKEI